MQPDGSHADFEAEALEQAWSDGYQAACKVVSDHAADLFWRKQDDAAQDVREAALLVRGAQPIVQEEWREAQAD